MTAFLTDFSGDSTGALGNSTAWTTGRQTGSWIHDVTVDGTAPGGKTVIYDDVGFGFDGIQSDYCDSPAATTGNFEVAAQIRVSTTLSGIDYPVVVGLINSSDNDTCYGIAYKGTGSWQVQIYVNGNVSSGVGSTTGNIFTPTANVAFYLRLTRNGTTIKGNVWGTSVGSEPAGFNIAGGTDTGIATLKGGIVISADAYTSGVDLFASSDGGDKTAVLSSVTAGSFLINARQGLGGMQDMSRGM